MEDQIDFGMHSYFSQKKKRFWDVNKEPTFPFSKYGTKGRVEALRNLGEFRWFTKQIEGGNSKILDFLAKQMLTQILIIHSSGVLIKNLIQ